MVISFFVTRVIMANFSVIFRSVVASAILGLLVSGCVSHNEIAMQIGAPPKAEEGKPTLNLRSIQTRRYKTLDEQRLLAAATQTYQDLGYGITESSIQAGVLVGSKERDAEESGQVAGSIMISLVFAAMGSVVIPTWDQSQKIVVTLTTSPVVNTTQTDVRVSFDRRLTNNHGDLWRSEVILDEKIYQEFFDKFSKSAFLEAHKL